MQLNYKLLRMELKDWNYKNYQVMTFTMFCMMMAMIKYQYFGSLHAAVDNAFNHGNEGLFFVVETALFSQMRTRCCLAILCGFRRCLWIFCQMQSNIRTADLSACMPSCRQRLGRRNGLFCLSQTLESPHKYMSIKQSSLLVINMIVQESACCAEVCFAK